MSIPFHSKLRIKFKNLINKFLIKFFSSSFREKKINPNKIKRILIIRINYRIGNILFLTPLIRALEIQIPDAKIDVLLGAKYTVSMIEPMPNINKVYDAPRKLLINFIALIRQIRLMNKNNYDLIISPVNLSTSSNLATLLLKAPYKLSFYNKTVWSSANITVKQTDNNNITHEALKLLELMNIFEGVKKNYPHILDIALTNEERKTGKQYLEKLLQEHRKNQNNSKIIGIFRDARFEKKISDEWWRKYTKELKSKNSDLVIIDILAPNNKFTISSDTIAVSIKNLRHLAQFFSSLDVFICADTGPMHLASASFVPVIALFNTTNSDIYGPLGIKDKSIVINGKTIEQIALQTLLNI